MDHNQINVSKDDLFGIAITPESILHAESEIVKNKIAVNALQILKKKVTENVTLNTSNTGISANMITKIAKAGIQLEDLRKVYSHGGYKGLLFSQYWEQQRCSSITTCKRVIKALADKLDEVANKL